MALYTLGDAARICRVSRRRLRYWTRTSLVPAARANRSQTEFGFRDLVAVRSVVGLLKGGVSLRSIRRSMEALREREADAVEGVGSLERWGDSSRLVMRRLGALIEPEGQLVFDFSGTPPDSGVARFAARSAPSGDQRGQAKTWFERGCTLEGRPGSRKRAEEAYLRAIEVDPDFADAHSNLGALYINGQRRAAARTCFEQALAIDPGHLEANLNLAALLEEEGRPGLALRHFKAAVERDPFFPDTHVSLALLYERLGLVRVALSYWRRYLQLAPDGSWSGLARGRIVRH